MSTTYTDLPYTNMPDSIDTLIVYQDVSEDTKQYVDEFLSYVEQGDFTSANGVYEAHPELKNIIVNSETINRMWQAIIALERFYLEDVQIYMNAIANKENLATLDDIGITTVTLPTSGWTQSSINSAYYEYSISNITVLVDSPDWGLLPANNRIPTEAEIDSFNEIVSMYADSSNSKLTFYAATLPTAQLKINVRGVR